MASKDQVSVTAFCLPRKFKDIFQEDIYPPAFSGVGQPLEEWQAGVPYTLPLISLKPQGVKSVYEVSKAEGGRSKKLDSMKKAGMTKEEIRTEVKADQKEAQMSQGELELLTGGYFWDAWVPHHVEIKKKGIYAFQTGENISAVPDESVEFVDMKTVEAGEEPQVLVIVKEDGSDLQFRAPTESERDVWVRAIIKAKETSEQQEQVGSGAPPVSSVVDYSLFSLVDLEEEAALTSGNKGGDAAEGGGGGGITANESDLPQPEGFLTSLEHGYFFNSWTRNYWKIDSDLILNKYSSEASDKPLERIHLDKVIAAHVTENTAECTFQIATHNRSWILKCDTEDEVTDWIQALEEIRRYLKLKNSDGEIVDAGSSVVQHSVLVKIGLFAWKKRFWVVAAGDDMLCYNMQGDYKPQHVYPCKNIIKFVLPVDKTNIQDFTLRMKDGTLSVFTCDTKEDREEYWDWYQEVSVAQNVTVDISRELGIDVEAIDTLSNKQCEAKMKGVLDLNEVKRGGQPVLVKIMGRLKTRGKVIEPNTKEFQRAACFVLDTGTIIYEWYGLKSNRFQRNKSLDIASRIRMKERGGNAKIIRLLESKDDDDERFWSALGGKIPMPEEFRLGVEDDKITRTRRLYRVYKNKINKIFEGTTLPSCKSLQPNAVFVVEAEYEFWSWFGGKSRAEDRKISYLLVEKLQAKLNEPWTCWARVAEGGETILFKENFADFPGQLMITAKPEGGGGSVGVAVRREQTPVDVENKMVRGEARPRYHVIQYDDGSATPEIWKIEGFDKVPFPKKYYGHCWSGDSYLMLYEYKVNSSEKALIYFWQGRDCSINEKGTSAYLTKEASDLLQGRASESKQIRVTQGSERAHWFTIFHNVYIIHSGRFEDGWETVDKPRLFEVWQATDGHVRAIEVDCLPTKLQSHRVFVLYTPAATFVWCGKSRTEGEQSIGFAVAENFKELSPEKASKISSVTENAETEEFWAAFPASCTDHTYFHNPVEFRPFMKLFEFSNATGIVDVEEQFDFLQDSLNQQKVMVVDSGFVVWVWFGTHCKVIEEKLALDSAIKYLQVHPKREADAPVYQTRAWQEPLEFTALFQAWNFNKLPRNFPKPPPPIMQRDGREVLKEYTRTVYSIAELTAPTLPKGIDPTNKEKYLSDEDFLSLFGMTKEEYEKKPGWKRETLKKQAALY